MPGPFVHRIDPVLLDLGSVYFWWYGLSYALGFLQVHLWLQRRRTALRLTPREAYVLSLWFAIGVLAGGRAVEVAFDEWPFYRTHAALVPALWLGGMATHGLLIGGASSLLLFSLVYGKSFLRLADDIVIPAAMLMGLGRIGNFIDGQIVGAITDVPWAVKFPDADGFRHPVVLYDGLKNLLLVPYLLRVRRTNPTPGAAAARFVFWYPALRIVIDLFRDYPTHRLALGTGQTLNIVMAALGLVLLVRSRMRRLGRLRPIRESVPAAAGGPDARPRAWQRLALAALMVFALAIPSNWTQDVPRKYAARHPGMQRSWLYPEIDTRPERQGIGSSTVRASGTLSRPDSALDRPAGRLVIARGALEEHAVAAALDAVIVAAERAPALADPDDRVPDGIARGRDRAGGHEPGKYIAAHDPGPSFRKTLPRRRGFVPETQISPASARRAGLVGLR